MLAIALDDSRRDSGRRRRICYDPRAIMSIYSLGERRVVFHGSEWFIAHNATVIGSSVLHHQASVWFNTVVRADSEIITIGERTNIQDSSVLHADPGAPLTLGKTSPSATRPCCTAAPSATARWWASAASS